jgi:tetratricopeptide (TPR) repeat protein
MAKTMAGSRFIAWRLWTSAILLSVVICGCGKSKSATSRANDLYLQAKGLLAAGKTSEALEVLNQSISVQPALWSYHERAKLQAQLGDDKAAMADCAAALELDSQDPDAAWLKSELAKPAAERFRGKFKSSPSSRR